ncbi:hypothetical protein HDG38_006683 [Paraburkholderia sp. WSM4177]|nr:hypothetical protein [Paraburkholderia sp. WSM4177]MBB5488421.1 hypothetical protein [Paraburkholderia sp. WSM4180]
MGRASFMLARAGLRRSIGKNLQLVKTIHRSQVLRGHFVSALAQVSTSARLKVSVLSLYEKISA